MFILTTKGGLGNALFIFANFAACAEETGATVANPAFDEFAPYFEATRRDLFCRYPARPSPLPAGPRARRLLNRAAYYATRALVRSGVTPPRVRPLVLQLGEQLDLEGEEFLRSLRPRSLYLIQGWAFSGARNLYKHAEAVRRYFRPAEEFERRVGAHVRAAREGSDILVGVHVRRGDYDTFQGGKFFYDAKDYARVMREVEALFAGRRVRFLVCSNVALDASEFAPSRVAFGPGHELEDMYCFARCDYLVGPPSTYTMWASFYGGVPLYMIDDPEARVSLESFVPFAERLRRSAEGGEPPRRDAARA